MITFPPFQKNVILFLVYSYIGHPMNFNEYIIHEIYNFDDILHH